MTPAALTLTAAAALLLLASASTSRASVEQGEGDSLPSISLDTLTDRAETIMNQITEQPSDAPPDVAAANVAAFLALLRQSEGTANSADPYAVCYAYRHTTADFSDHPAITGEWAGERLSDAMCANAGFGPGCVSTAAGAYQIIRPTWRNLRDRLGLPDFTPASQDAAAVELVRLRGALEDVKAGRLAVAVGKCRNEWASLPGNFAKQGQRSIETLAAWYSQNGGKFA